MTTSVPTYVDSGVLIRAARGTDALSEQALKIVENPQREFVSSAFVELEVLPKAVYHRRTEEVAFYREFFASTTRRAELSPELMAHARRLAEQYGLSAVDALHVACALSLDPTNSSPPKARISRCYA